MQIFLVYLTLHVNSTDLSDLLKPQTTNLFLYTIPYFFTQDRHVAAGAAEDAGAEETAEAAGDAGAGYAVVAVEAETGRAPTAPRSTSTLISLCYHEILRVKRHAHNPHGILNFRKI